MLKERTKTTPKNPNYTKSLSVSKESEETKCFLTFHKTYIDTIMNAALMNAAPHQQYFVE